MLRTSDYLCDARPFLPALSPSLNLHLMLGMPSFKFPSYGRYLVATPF